VRAEAREARTVVGVGGVSVQSTKTMNRWRNRRSATSFRYEILWEVPNFWVGFFLVSRGMVGSVTRFHICPLS